MRKDRLTEYLDEKFQRFEHHRINDTTVVNWFVHSWDYFGADYGFIITMRYGKMSLSSFSDSQYGPSKLILDDIDDRMLWTLIESFSPTNSDYKTDK